MTPANWAVLVSAVVLGVTAIVSSAIFYTPPGGSDLGTQTVTIYTQTTATTTLQGSIQYSTSYAFLTSLTTEVQNREVTITFVRGNTTVKTETTTLTLSTTQQAASTSVSTTTSTITTFETSTTNLTSTVSTTQTSTQITTLVVTTTTTRHHG